MEQHCFDFSRPLISQIPPYSSNMPGRDDHATFHEALNFYMNKHGDTYRTLHRAIIDSNDNLDPKTIREWQNGTKHPRALTSLEILYRIETRYNLPSGYFKEKLPHPARASQGYRIDDMSPSEQRRISWHLPADFNDRSNEERKEIIEWIRTNIISGATDYRRYHARATKDRFGIKFINLSSNKSPKSEQYNIELPNVDGEYIERTLYASVSLENEMKSLLEFKTSTLTALGYQRIVYGAMRLLHKKLNISAFSLAHWQRLPKAQYLEKVFQLKKLVSVSFYSLLFGIGI